MAKRTVTAAAMASAGGGTAASGIGAVNLTIDQFSKDARKEFGSLKADVMGPHGVKAFSGFREKMSEIAPRLRALFLRCKTEALGMKDGDGNPIMFGVADFARLYDPTVPFHPRPKGDVAGYQQHPTYYGVNYILNQLGKKGTKKGSADGRGKIDAATDGLARAIASELTRIVKDDHPAFWGMIGAELRLSAKALATLQRRADAAKPLIDWSKIMKPISLKGVTVIHMESRKDVAPVAASEDAEDNRTAASRRRSA
jgi:hypothetical protein